MVRNMEQFPVNSDIHHINTRQHANLHQSSANVTKYQKGMYCLGVKVFNPLAYTDVCETAGLARSINPLKPELNPICNLLALLGAHHFLPVSRIRVKLLTFRLLMSYIY